MTADQSGCGGGGGREFRGEWWPLSVLRRRNVSIIHLLYIELFLHTTRFFSLSYPSQASISEPPPTVTDRVNKEQRMYINPAAGERADWQVAS